MGDNYEKLDFLGQGGFGAVFKIRHKKSGEIFAAKISLKYFLSKNEQQLLYIKREVNAMLALNHPSVLKFEGFSLQDFFTEPKPVIVMEFAAGNSVQQQINLERVSQAGPWDETKKLICVYGLASGMKYLHSNNMIHRDLKPDNILLTEELLPKIADFGLAKQIHSNKDSMTTESEFSFKGTKNYCSPEIFLANFYSKASDVYAFAMTVYAIMTTETPFKGLEREEIKSKVINGERPPIPESLMNPAYESLIQRCWSQDPKKRPSFDEIVNELETKDDFITDVVDENEYFEYVEYLKKYSTTFDPSKRIELTQLFLQISNQKNQKVDKSSQQRNDTQTDQHALKEFSRSRVEERSQEKSVQDLKIEADQGDIDAMFNYGWMLRKGEGVKMNKKEACRYYQMAADKGHIEAMYNYGCMLQKAEGVGVNKKESCRYYQMAADKGHISAMYNYGCMLDNGEGVSMNKEEACRYYQMAADKGQIDAMYNYGLMLEKGEGVQMNTEEACRYYEMAADKGHIKAMFNYGVMLENGEGVEMNTEKACHYYQMAADKGDIDAMYNYGEMLYYDEKVEMNKEQACQYYKMAADKGQIEAMYKYGVMLQKGEGVSMNKEEACRYYKMAVDKGHTKAMYNYAVMLDNGDGVEMNKEEANRYYAMARSK